MRAYQRKAWLAPGVRHQRIISEIHGCDISLFAAHLSTLNLAARNIIDEENYPRIARKNFFEARDDKAFCYLPEGLSGDRKPGPIQLPRLDAVVGNPPYVRQELIPKRGAKGAKRMQAKEDLKELCAKLWPGLELSGRSDLHCYFWPAARQLLKEDGWFGFLVSSSWLDVEYGFSLQGWLLSNFKLHAVIESTAEPWFEDARVKTCAVIMQRCQDPDARLSNLVKFVRLKVPLAELLGDRPEEGTRQKAAEEFRDQIQKCKTNTSTDELRIIVRKQKDLWEAGLKAGELFAAQKMRLQTGDENEENEEEENEDEVEPSANLLTIFSRGYGGGKWGKYLRDPDLYFDIVDRFGGRLVP